MKVSNFKKYTLLGIGSLIASCGLFVGGVNAGGLEFGPYTTKDNTITIPVKINVTEEDAPINSIKPVCETNNEEVTCEIKEDDSGSFNLVTGGIIYNGGENYPVGNNTCFKVVVTNESANAVSDLVITVKDTQEKVSDANMDSLNVKAKKVKSSNASISSIVFSSGAIYPTFDPDFTEYTVFDIKDSVSSVKLSPVCSEGACSFSITGGAGVNYKTVSLKDGINEVKLTVTAEDQITERIYNFKIIRGESNFGSAYLGELTTGDYTLAPAFVKETLNYSMIIPNRVTTLTSIMNCVAADEENGAKCEINGYDNLKEGENKVTIKVTSTTGDTKEYVILVNRLSSNGVSVKAFLNNEVTFVDSNGETQSLNLQEFKKLYEEEAAKITSGIYKFDEAGNLIVESEKKDDSEPVKEEEKKEETNIKKIIIIVVLIIVGIAIIVIAGILIFKKKDPEIEESTDLSEEEKNDNESENEEVEELPKTKELDKTLEIDEALSDLMTTKQYDFDDKD